MYAAMALGFAVVYIWAVVAYLVFLVFVSYRKSRQVKTQDEPIRS